MMMTYRLVDAMTAGVSWLNKNAHLLTAGRVTRTNASHNGKGGYDPQARVGKTDWPAITMSHDSHLIFRKSRRSHTLGATISA